MDLKGEHLMCDICDMGDFMREWWAEKEAREAAAEVEAAKRQEQARDDFVKRHGADAMRNLGRLGTLALSPGTETEH
jgi:hypothetical protein